MNNQISTLEAMISVVMNYRQSNKEGDPKRITTGELRSAIQSLTGERINGAEIRNLVHQIRTRNLLPEGFVLISDNQGYGVTKDPDLIMECYLSLWRRSTAISRAANGVYQGLIRNEPGIGGQFLMAL